MGASLPYQCNHRTVVDEEWLDDAALPNQDAELRRGALTSPVERARGDWNSRPRQRSPAGMLALLRREGGDALVSVHHRLQIAVPRGNDGLVRRDAGRDPSSCLTIRVGRAVDVIDDPERGPEGTDRDQRREQTIPEEDHAERNRGADERQNPRCLD